MGMGVLAMIGPGVHGVAVVLGKDRASMTGEEVPGATEAYHAGLRAIASVIRAIP